MRGRTYVHMYMKVWEDMVCMTVCSYTDEESGGQDAPICKLLVRTVQRRVKIHHLLNNVAFIYPDDVDYRKHSHVPQCSLRMYVRTAHVVSG